MEKKHLWKPSEHDRTCQLGQLLSTSIGGRCSNGWGPEGATKSRNICPLCSVDRRSTWTIPDRKNHLQIEHCENFICFRIQYWIDVARVILPRILPREQRSCLWVYEWVNSWFSQSGETIRVLTMERMTDSTPHLTQKTQVQMGLAAVSFNQFSPCLLFLPTSFFLNNIPHGPHSVWTCLKIGYTPKTAHL
jgi:hypothetical protein